MTISMTPKLGLVLPAFGEVESLPILLSQLSDLIDLPTVILIIDDSIEEVSIQSQKLCSAVTLNSNIYLIFHRRGRKLGRGSAVREGLRILFDNFPSIEYFAEADSDGSHNARDIWKLISASTQDDFLIGSRYLPTSEIIGWSFARKLMSRSLNILIPKIFGVSTTDITNGLRRYSRSAVRILLSLPQESLGFIYLSEQAIILKENEINPKEIPINFAERIGGRSSVNMKLLKQSVMEIHKLLVNR